MLTLPFRSNGRYTPTTYRNDSPYKGLRPYEERDERFFFGRNRECDLILANLYTSRFTLLYGPSGVGKSSILQAGIAHRLHQQPRRGVVVFRNWHGDPLAELKQMVRNEVEHVLGAPLPLSNDLPLDEFITEAARGLRGPLILILDQVEDYLNYLRRDDEDESGFAAEFAGAVNDNECPISVLVALREDALAMLDRFERRIPNLFDNYLRLEYLDVAAAREAIEHPLMKYNEGVAAEQAISIEPALVQAVIDQVQRGQIILGQIGRGQFPARTDETEPGGAADPKTEIETAYLQLVMERLWREERANGSLVLRLSTFQQLGGAADIVQGHVDEAMKSLTFVQQEDAAHIFRYLVTPAGTKISLSAADLNWFTHIPEQRIELVAKRLIEGEWRILRRTATNLNVVRYEIFHDTLGQAVLDWSARYFSRWSVSRSLFLIGFGLVLLAIVLMFLPLPPLLLGLVRAVPLFGLNIVALMQMYQWFTRYIDLTAGRSRLAVNSGPNLALWLSIIFTICWLSRTSRPDNGTILDVLPPLTQIEFVEYWFLTTALTLSGGLLTFVTMLAFGRLTQRIFKSFPLGFYGIYALICLALLIVIFMTSQFTPIGPQG